MNLLRALLRFYQEGRRVKPAGLVFGIIALIAVPLTVFEIWLGLWGALQPLTIATLFVTALFTVSFLTVSRGQGIDRITVFDFLLAGLSFICGVYLVAQTPRYVEWISGISEFTALDLAVGTVTLLLTLELLRRCVGFGLSMVVYALLAYVFFGHFIPGTFSHRQLDFPFFIEEMIISLNGGIFGQPIQVAATYAFLFIVFGKVIEGTGGGRFFFDMASAIAGRQRGGVAKVAVVSSGLFGMISGSPAADVMTTGSITIPAMKRQGYSARMAGAIEAVACTGGSILPPVMGATVFLMAEFTGIAYVDIAKSAVALALLYYFAVYLQVHLHAGKEGLKGMEQSQIVGLGTALREGWHNIIPFVVLIYFLLEGYTAAYVAGVGVLTAIGISWLRPGFRVTPKRAVHIAVNTVHALGPLVAAVAAAGIVIGALNLTGMAGKMSSLIFAMADGSLLLSLIVAAAITILLGMGMPTVAAYALVAVLVAPVLIELGLSLLQAHLFLVYYSVLSAITPPVAIAAYVASSIADASPMDIAWDAVKLGLVAFVLPFMFVYQPGLLLVESWPVNIEAILTAFVGTAFLCLGVSGWFGSSLAWWQRIALIVGGLAVISPHWPSELLGLGVCSAVLTVQHLRGRRGGGARSHG